MTPSVDSPTVIVGIGGSGIDIIDRLQQTVREEGYNSEEFLFFGIDSREIDNINEIDRWDQQTTSLSWKERKEWKDKFREYNFLRETDDIPPEEGGVQRKRHLARALIDDESNINQVISGLRFSITNFEDQFNDDTLDIWVVNSLGGGTGSGMLPIVLGLMQWLEPSEFDSNINLHALVSLPQLDLKADDKFQPSIDSRAVPNSFAALSELRELLDVAHSDTTGVDIELQHDVSKVDLFKTLQDNRAPIRRDHFEEVYLMGIDEDNISQDSGNYAARVEKLATNTILAHAVSSENFPDPDDPSLDNRILHTNDLVELRFPYETAADFVKLKATSIRLEEDKESLSDLRDQFQSNREFVNDVTTIQEGSDNPEVASLFAYCRDSIDEIDENTFQRLDKESLKNRIEESVSISSDEVENLKTEFKQTRKYRESVSEDRRPAAPGSWSNDNPEDDSARLPEQSILNHLAYTSAKERAEELQSQAQLDFESALDELWDAIRGDLDDVTVEDYRSYDDAHDKWEFVVSEAASQRIQDLREGGIIRSYDDEADKVADRRDEVQRHKTRVEDFATVVDALDELSDNTLGNLRNLVSWYSDSIDSIKNTIDRIESRQTTLDREYDSKKEYLTTPSYRGSKYGEMALTDPDALIDEYFSAPDTGVINRLNELVEEYGGDKKDDELDKYRRAAEQYLRETVDVKEYDAKGIINGNDLYKGARLLLENIEERVADDGTMQDGIVLPMKHPDDDWLDVMDEEDYEALITGVSGGVSNCKISSVRGHCGNRGTIRFLFTNPNITLDECSEYSTLEQWYHDHTILDVLETEADTPEGAVNFAYPELVDFLSEET